MKARNLLTVRGLGRRVTSVLAGGLLATMLSAGAARADVVANALLDTSPSDGSLVINQNFDITISVLNNSHDVPLLPFVPATLTGTTIVKLACTESQCATELPNTLTYNSCTPNAAVASCAADPGN